MSTILPKCAFVWIFLGFILALLVLAEDQDAIAEKCWRNTPCSGPKQPAFPGPWQTSIYAPPRRVVRPRTVLMLPDGKAISQFPAPMTLRGNGSSFVFDFGIEVGGILSFNYSASGPASVGLAFSESRLWMGEWSDSSNGKFKGPDGALYADIDRPGRGLYTMPDRFMRGGFRYLTMFLKTVTDVTVDIVDIKLEISFQPTWPHLQAYQGYFHCSDELLNRIWYAGAYTLQTNSVPVNMGRQVPMLAAGWANNATMGPGSSILVDGAKRDRAVWPGDMGVASPAIFVSTGDLESVKNALQVMFDYQNKDGSLPEAGPPLLQQNSDTYHMWTLIGVYNYILYSNDTQFLENNWPRYSRALDYVIQKMDKTNSLLNVTGKRDWARWQQGGFNAEASMILYQTLVSAAQLARWLARPESTQLSHRYSQLALRLQASINQILFDPTQGAYRDNATDIPLYPQDANSLALLFNISTADNRMSISNTLHSYWTDIGPASPELPGNISPFITSFELAAHFSIGLTDRALDLLRRTWGWYANHPDGTGSTVIEGYRTDGTFGYRAERGYGNDPSYVSHAHGWSSGPTSSLTNFIVGLRVIDRAGKRWAIAPQLGDLTFAEAGFTTKLGRFRVAWQRIDGAVNSSTSLREFIGYDLQMDTPLGTEGEIHLPFPENELPPTVLLSEVSGIEPDVRWRRDGNSLVTRLMGGVKSVIVRHKDDDVGSTKYWGLGEDKTLWFKRETVEKARIGVYG